MVEKIKKALERAYQDRRNIVKTDVGNDLHREDTEGKSENSSNDFLTQAAYREVDLFGLAANRVITYDDADGNIESYRLLRTQLIRKRKTDAINSLGITSPNAGEGKSLTSVNLAISLAKTADVNVILVDGDIVHPSIHHLFDVKLENGLIDYLKGDAEIQEIITRLNIPNLWLVPGRIERVSLLDQTSSSHIDDLIDKLTSDERNFVIVDLPPVLGKDDSVALATHLDGVVMVVEEGVTRSDELSRAVDLLRESNLIGSVLNKYNHKQVSYY